MLMVNVYSSIMLNKNIKILCIILARGGSKSIKNKNIVKFNKYPLIAYTIHEALKSKIFEDIIVSTDDKKIKKISKLYGAKVPFLRPKIISKDNSRPIDALYHATKIAERIYKKKYNYIMELMCTNPFKTYKDILEVSRLQIKTNADSVIALHKLEDHHPIRIKKIVNGYIKNFCLKEIPESRRQDLKPTAYIRSGSIYSMRRDMLEKKIRYGTKKSVAYIIPNSRVVNIDTKMDLEFAKFYAKKIKLKLPEKYLNKVKSKIYLKKII